ncbi:hypothetical protein TNCV_4826951 [Trichonephila clavipes]|nr:hypothetical protein TNCV_4826951 [Trichonephila clavipes]
MRARAYCAHLSMCDLWALRYMSRCPNQVVNLKRDLNAKVPKQAHLSTHCSRDERLSQPCPAQELNPDLWCGSTKCCHWTLTSHLRN